MRQINPPSPSEPLRNADLARIYRLSNQIEEIEQRLNRLKQELDEYRHQALKAILGGSEVEPGEFEHQVKACHSDGKLITTLQVRKRRMAKEPDHGPRIVRKLACLLLAFVPTAQELAAAVF